MKLLKLLFITCIVLSICGPAYARIERGSIHIDGNGTSPFNILDWNRMNGVTAGDGTKKDPFIIESFEIDCEYGSYGIWIENSSHYFILRDHKIYNAENSGAGRAIWIDNCDHATIDDTWTLNNDNGLYLTRLTTATVTGSSFNQNVNDGLVMNRVTSSTVYNTHFLFNEHAGIALTSSGGTSANGNCFSYLFADENRHSFFLDGSDYNEFFNSTSTDATRDGVVLQDSHHNSFSIESEGSEDGGFVLYSSDYNDFEKCVVYENGYREGYEASTHGFYLDHSSYNEIYDCTIEDNFEYAVFIDDDDSDGNRIFNNNITGNNDGDVQAWDNADTGSTDWWDDTIPGWCGRGNYWGACAWGYVQCYYYIGAFCNADYQIDGPANSEDEYPSPTAYSF